MLSFDAAVHNVKKVDNFEEKSQETEIKLDSEIQEEPETKKPKESAVISRETEGEFRLLGRMEGSKRVSFRLEDNNKLDDYYVNDEEYWEGQESDRREPEITCRHLDHVNMSGLNKTTLRLRFLVNWLVTSLLQLRLPGTNGEHELVPLVHIYGPKIKYERGASVAFNVRGRRKELISPEIVQKLAEANGISLGVGIICHARIIQSTKQNLADTTVCKPMNNDGNEGGFVRAEVVTASLGFLTNFEDVYKLWVFVAKFLDPSFIGEDGGLSDVEGQETETG